MENIIEVNHLTKDYGSKRGVFDVTFHISKGEAFGFLGPNGAGKSTTIRHLLGFSKPDSGETKIFGKEMFKYHDQVLSRIGYIPGEIALPRGLTGWQFIRMMQDMQNIHNDEMLQKMLKMFKLEDNVLCGNTKRMSLGVKRKLAIVVAFMSDPEVLILDEPTSGLDPVMQEVFIDYIKEEKKRGRTILLSSHIFSEIDATCDRISIIKNGHIVSEFVADDLKHTSIKCFKVCFKEKCEYKEVLKDIEQSEYIKLIKKNEENNAIYLSCDDKDINKLVTELSKYDITEFDNKKETLQDYFMKFYKEDNNFGDAL